MVLCNNIHKVDDAFVEDNMDMFYTECEECKGEGEKDEETCDECTGDGQHECEPYQYFLINVDNWTREHLESWGVTIGDSDALELEVIAIYDFGTSWRMFDYSREVEDDYILGALETNERQTHY